MTFEHMQFILAIIKNQSISKTAVSLKLSQPYLSSVVKSMESELHFKIFNRNHRGVTLTEDGHTFAGYCEQITLYMDKINDLTFKNKIHNESFSVVTHFSYTLLNLFYAFTVDQNINSTSIKFQEVQNSTIPNLILNNQFDIGIMHIESSTEHNHLQLMLENGLRFYELFREPLYAVVSKNHPLYHCDHVSLLDLNKYPLLIEKFKKNLEGFVNETSTLFNIFKSFCVEDYSFENNRSLFFYLSKSDTHFTLGQLSHNTYNPYVINGDLRYIPIIDLDEQLITGYITQTKLKENFNLKNFLTYLKNHYPNELNS